MIQGLVCILPGVVLDKIPSGRKFTIGYLTSNILNPSSLMLTELQKSPISFNSFEKDVSLWSESREKELDCWDTSVKMQLMLRQRPPLLGNLETIPWRRPQTQTCQLGILNTSTPKKLSISLFTHPIPILHDPTIAM